ncbi:MAG TPA: DUF1326 domain-containing protein [Tepidisphaeraceae bacterium]
MRLLICCTLGLLISATRAPAPAGHAPITGDYVEARTASVFAGACHYNGELVTTGRDAIAAWSFASGAWHGVDLSGVRAVAAISSDANLGQDSAARKTVLVVDSAASQAQAGAVVGLLKEKCGRELGQILSVRRDRVAFDHTSKEYRVAADGFAALSVRPMPNNECCTQPELVWYSPLAALTHRKVGYTLNASYTGSTAGEPWQREGENSAFYGGFSW